MKVLHVISAFLVMGSITSCQTSRESDEVVCQAVHRYGVCLEPEDWSSRGQNGQIVSMRKDGVTVTRTYDAGVVHGECTYTFPYRDVVQTKENYQQGCLREKSEYYSSGNPQKTTVYETPSRQLVTMWYETGAPYAKEQVDNGRLIEGEYYHFDHQEVESRVEGGNGLRTTRDGHGQLQSIDTVLSGQVSSSTTYHPNGVPAAVTPYSKGQIQGDRITYHPGGEPATIEKWSGNTQHGITTVYEHGEKRAEVPYVNGGKQGVEVRFRDDGQTVAQEVTWVNNQKHGPSYSYMGNTVKTDWYFCNRPVPNKATFDMLSNQ